MTTSNFQNVICVWQKIADTCDLINIVADSDVGTRILVVLAMDDPQWKQKIKELLAKPKPQRPEM